MNIKDDDMEWKKEASHLANLPNTNPFIVPEKYFDELQPRINQSVFVDSLMQKEDQGFKVPENYFEELNANIMATIAVDKFTNAANNQGFNTPDNYFKNLNAAILSKTITVKPKSKIFKLWHSDLLKYAAAACFILVTTTTIYLNQQQNSIPQSGNIDIANEMMLYGIDESVIIEHLQESQNVNANMATTEEMENYILDNYSSNDLSNNL